MAPAYCYGEAILAANVLDMHTREDAWALLTEWTRSESLRKHALSVEASMRYYAKLWDEDEELWGNTGLLHDFDYEKHPSAEGHPETGIGILKEQGWPDELIYAIGGHAQYLQDTYPRTSKLDKALFACDELSGLIVAVAYTRPAKTLAEVEVKSVMKKMKDTGFAKGVNRDDVIRGAEELGIPLEEHVANCLKGLQEASGKLGM